MPFWSRGRHDDSSANMHLIVGLGNPGRQYERTRHNIGFMVIERLAERHGMRFAGSKHGADVARGAIAGLPVMLAMPTTFMNESGFAVARLCRYFRVSPDRLLVVVDEMDLPFGTLRLRPDGSSAGHRGVQSVIRELGTSDFARLRIGIGRPEHHAISHVLQRFSPEQEAVLPALIDTAVDAVGDVLKNGVRAAMNRYNRDWMPELTGCIP